MSRSYSMRVEVAKFKKGKSGAVVKACLGEWDFDSDEVEAKAKSIILDGDGDLCGGETEQEFVDRLSKAVWEANGGYCEIEVQATCYDDMPCVAHYRNRKDYKRIAG
jgi:hypothetical protein